MLAAPQPPISRYVTVSLITSILFLGLAGGGLYLYMGLAPSQAVRCEGSTGPDSSACSMAGIVIYGGIAALVAGGITGCCCLAANIRLMQRMYSAPGPTGNPYPQYAYQQVGVDPRSPLLAQQATPV